MVVRILINYFLINIKGKNGGYTIGLSAEQFIGMSGSGFKMGLAIATYEWMAAASLLIVAVFFVEQLSFALRLTLVSDL